MSNFLRTAANLGLGIVRVLLATLILIIFTVATASAAVAQSLAAGSVELRPLVGAFVPTGDQRDALASGVLLGAQTSYRVTPFFAFTASFAWSPNRDRIRPGDERLDVYQYDVGAELRAADWAKGGGWIFTPLVGLGIGGRTYDYRDLDAPGKSNFGGYGALGGEVAFGHVGVRVEGRDYVTGFKPLYGGGDASTRNDVSITAGLTLRF